MSVPRGAGVGAGAATGAGVGRGAAARGTRAAGRGATGSGLVDGGWSDAGHFAGTRLAAPHLPRTARSPGPPTPRSPRPPPRPMTPPAAPGPGTSTSSSTWAWACWAGAWEGEVRRDGHVASTKRRLKPSPLKRGLPRAEEGRPCPGSSSLRCAQAVDVDVQPHGGPRTRLARPGRPEGGGPAEVGHGEKHRQTRGPMLTKPVTAPRRRREWSFPFRIPLMISAMDGERQRATGCGKRARAGFDSLEELQRRSLRRRGLASANAFATAGDHAALTVTLSSPALAAAPSSDTDGVGRVAKAGLAH